jgi:thiol-disulfide isomerase/thioredoxin
MIRPRRLWLGAGVGAVAALAGAGVAWWRLSPEHATDDPQGLWAMRFARPEGPEFVMSHLTGKPLILNFWATWCVPCIREMPAFERFLKSPAGQGWQVLALAVDAPVPVIEFIGRFKLGLPVALAGIEGLELMRRLGNQQGGLPFTVAFRADGRVLDRKLGETRDEDLVNWSKKVIKS